MCQMVILVTGDNNIGDDEEEEPDDDDDLMVMMMTIMMTWFMIATKNLAFIESNIALLSFPALFTMAPE